MSNPGSPVQDAAKFSEDVRTQHRRINPCFMTGKGCVHTEHIDTELKMRKGLAGFNVRPFQPNIETAHRLTLERFLQANYSSPNCELRLDPADRVRRTGYVVCEKICRRIQASDFVLVDISAPNANVFYELGLAYGINQKILVVYQAASEFGQKAATCLKDGGCRAFAYRDLDPIRPEDLVLSNYLWTRTYAAPQSRAAPTIALITQSYGFLAWGAAQGGTVSNGNSQSKSDDASKGQKTETSPIDKALGPRDIHLDFETHVKAAVGVAVDNIVQKLQDSPPGTIMQKYIDLVTGLKTTDQIKKDAGFHEVLQQVEQSFCTIIQTGGKVSDPMAYFWLGYCHALGKNVVPVTVVNEANDNIDDLAFDLRALWHMTFILNDPAKFSQELEETLQQVITSDFAEWSRGQFWDEVLGRRGKVSIFTGALHNAPIGREMIGDWDLRAASELTSYLTSHQYRVTIESPVYQIEQVTGAVGTQKANVSEEDYISELEQMLRGKNCVVIASPDVNPLTELLLGKLYDVERKEWFKSGDSVESYRGAVIAFKEVEPRDAPPEGLKGQAWPEPSLARAFYRRVQVNRPEGTTDRLKRGFLGHGVPGGRLEGAFLSQTDPKDKFSVHAHLVVARNPFDKSYHVIILNGVSGPATFALTHVLTGGSSIQFVDYPESFLPESRSEGFLQRLNQDMELLKDRFLGLQYFFSVQVGSTHETPGGKRPLGRDIFDWRKILHWERVAVTGDCAFGRGDNSAN